MVIIADHGWQIGERRMHGKNGLGVAATNIPLIIRKQNQLAGYTNWNPVSQLDVFPTLIELTFGKQALIDYTDDSGLPLDGVSLVPALNNPSIAPNDYVISQYPRCRPIDNIQDADCMTAPHNNAVLCNNGGGRPKITAMGYLLVNKNGDRYTEWRHFNEERTNCAPATWPDMPASIKSGWSYPAWQMKSAKSCTNWQRAGIQQELYRDEDETNNYAYEPTPAISQQLKAYSEKLRGRLSIMACR